MEEKASGLEVTQCGIMNLNDLKMANSAWYLDSYLGDWYQIKLSNQLLEEKNNYFHGDLLSKKMLQLLVIINEPFKHLYCKQQSISRPEN